MKLWKIAEKPTEIYEGWEMYYEYTKTYGMTTGHEDFRVRAIKNGLEHVLNGTPYDKSQHKLRVEAKKQLDNIDAYIISLNNN